MGGRGSGKRKILKLDESSKNLIKAYRSRGYPWATIAIDLGFKSSTPIDDFRRENPDFERECSLVYGKLKMSLTDRFIAAALPTDGKPANSAMANKLAERFGIIDKDGAIQINNNIINASDSNSIKELSEKLTELSDDDLLKIISKQPQQLPEAIDAEVITNADL